MNLAEKQARLTAVLSDISQLRAIETPTEEQRESAQNLINEARELRSQIETLEAQERELGELQQFAGRAVQGRDMGGKPFIPVQGQGDTRTPNDEFLSTWTADARNRGLSDKQVLFAAGEEYRNEFRNYLRTGTASRALNESLISDGGALVPAEMAREIIQRRQAPNRLYNAVRKIRGSTDSISIPKHLGGSSTQQSNLSVQWLGEAGSAAEDTSLENFGTTNIQAHRGGFVVTCSRSLIEDQAFDIEGWVAEMIADTYTQTIESIILNGSGVGRPWGILTRAGSAAGQVDTFNIGNPISAEGMINLLGEIDEQYAANASFVMRRGTFFTQIADLKDSQGGFYFGTFMNTDGGAAARVESQILGYPNLMSDHMPALGAGNNVVLYGDLNLGYALLERVTMSIEPYIDPTIQKKDQKGWYVRFRLGGDVWQEEAMVIGVNS